MTGTLQICIHRGSKEIGGSCVEMMSDGTRVVIDLGLPLDVEYESAALPESLSFGEEAGARPSALLLSHGHRDHWGLLPKAPADIDVYVGRKALSMMRAAAPFVPGGYAPEKAVTYEHAKSFRVGPFGITPYLMDHSGFDAYGFLVEAGGRRVYYSGDLRGHGRKAAMFERFQLSPPANIDVLLMEGSSLGRLSKGRALRNREGNRS